MVKAAGPRHVYGPVPSRRLGRSLGVDLVPYKTCTYDCVYCQLGRTTDLTVERRAHVDVDAVLDEIECALGSGQRLHYITLAGSGESTLDLGIGDIIAGIKGFSDVPLAVLTNGSLLWMAEVREALMGADLVIPSLDAGDRSWFYRVNRPHPSIDFEVMVSGIEAFTRAFAGEVWLEVMLLAGATGTPDEVASIADRVRRIAPDRVQLNTAWRPPAEASVRPLPNVRLERFASAFPGVVDIVAERPEHLSEGTGAAGIKDEDILSLVSRRPCTLEDIADGLGAHVAEVLKHLDALRTAGRITAAAREGRIFWIPS
ncbi:MAG TPA: radical SAM protein [Actinobacteria bacterium]|nr:radical SAM protein [Actinomycetota bacterium]